MRFVFFLFLAPLMVAAQKQPVDLIVHNAKIYTVDSLFTTAEAMAVKGGKVIATGSAKAIQQRYTATEQFNAGGNYIYPGFIDAHAHFVGYALGLQTANLVGTTSWHAVLKKVESFAQTNGEGWLVGRGWDQNDWAQKEFPTNAQLDSLFGNRPVFLERVDGHAAIVNSKALELAGIKPGTQLTGGTVETKEGQLTGVLIDNAVELVASKIPQPTPQQFTKALLDAQRACFAVGLTTVDDCGLSAAAILSIDTLQKSGALKMRIYAMLSDAPENYAFAKSRGKIKTDFLNVRSFKVYADGALGSRGACLLQPYTDKKHWTGFLLSSQQHFDSVAHVIDSLGFQMCTHAIGDSGNRTILDIYAKHLQGANNKRWRIEHAQVVAHEDLKKFGAFKIIPSVQPTHATSDMYWAKDRLGKAREQTAYAYKNLLAQNGWLPLGTDFPVEDISPFKTFYAAVFRQDAAGFPKGGYQMQNALTRQQALRGITIWAARSNFEESEKGSLEGGKWADFVVVDTDLMTAPAARILKARVTATFVSGKKQDAGSRQP